MTTAPAPFARSLRLAALRLALCVIVGAGIGVGVGCKPGVPSGAPGSATAMGHWDAWRDLGPLVEIARTHATAPAIEALEQASALLREGKAASADKRLAQAADSSGRHWIAVARANLAALHFEVCIRGVAWRLGDEGPPNPTERRIDFAEDTRIAPGDISVEALLTNLEAAFDAEIPALVTQARIARARVAAFTQRCAANEDVAELAQRTLESDLAILAAEGHLTPDLAYLWAGVQLNRFSGSAARPFLLQAREGGFDHPAVTFMLAVIALEERDLDRADALADEAGRIYAAAGDTENVAEALFVRGEVARARGDHEAAQGNYHAALKQTPMHLPSMLAIAGLVHAQRGEYEATDELHRRLPTLMLEGPLDEARAFEVASNLEALVVLATEPLMAQVSRDALLQDIEEEPDPVRRGLRYFYAATLDVRLREYEVARGHAVLARDELDSADIRSPIDVQAFLDRLSGTR
jgi:tetratricopeptide (TPR) repeat protein